MTLFAHWSDVPKASWRWSHFTPRELASKGDGSLLVVPEALDTLERAREIIGKPLVIYSAYRDPIYNAKVGGAPLSMHKQGMAFDIALAGHSRAELLRACQQAGFTGFGGYSTFLHADIGRARRWGQSWAF